MPPVKRTKKQETPAAITVKESPKVSPELSIVDRLAELLWKHGDYRVESVRQKIVAAGIRLDSISPAMLSKAEEMNTDRLRQTFHNSNNDPSQPLKVVVPGDHDLDPALNPNHPVRGAAAIRLEQETLERQQRKSKTVSGSGQRHTSSVQGVRYEMCGFPVTAVIRWMGKDGWTWQEAVKVLQAKGMECALSTIKQQVRRGSQGSHGPPASLSESQADELRQLAGRK